MGYSVLGIFEGQLVIPIFDSGFMHTRPTHFQLCEVNLIGLYAFCFLFDFFISNEKCTVLQF